MSVYEPGDSRTDSIVRALKTGSETVEPTPGPMLVTTSTSGSSAGDHALRAIRESDGSAYAIERTDVFEAIKTAGRRSMFIEPASALSLVGAERVWEEGMVDPGAPIVCLATGAGVKWPDHTREAAGTASVIDPTLNALERERGIDRLHRKSDRDDSIILQIQEHGRSRLSVTSPGEF